MGTNPGLYLNPELWPSDALPLFMVAPVKNQTGYLIQRHDLKFIKMNNATLQNDSQDANVNKDHPGLGSPVYKLQFFYFIHDALPGYLPTHTYRMGCGVGRSAITYLYLVRSVSTAIFLPGCCTHICKIPQYI